MAGGNEDRPVWVYRSVIDQLADPVVVPPATVQLVIEDMRHTLEAHPPHTRSYDVVETLMAPVGGALPATGACLARIAAHSRRRSGDGLPHPGVPVGPASTTPTTCATRSSRRWSTAGWGDRPLVVIEEAPAPCLRRPGGAGTDFDLAVRGGRSILGPDFEAWYASIRGKGYARETFRLF